MRAEFTLVSLLALLVPLASAWSKEDREIFRIRDEVATHEAPGMTFYDVLAVSVTATQDDITKAYRRLSKALHPDKVQQTFKVTAEKALRDSKNSNSDAGKVKKAARRPPSDEELRVAIKKASERQARLILIANILKGPGRVRYDHFLQNGFPVWKGTEYYYTRYRPGLPGVIAGLFLVGGGGIHYIALYMSWRRKREFVERYIHFARGTAWGGTSLGIPGLDGTAATGSGPGAAAENSNDDVGDSPGLPRPSNRKQRRTQERDARKDTTSKDTAKKSKKRIGDKQTANSTSKKRVIAENGKVMVVDSLGNVYLEQEDSDGNVEELLLDPNELPRPRIQDTMLVRLPVWLYRTAAARLLGRKSSDADVTVDGYVSSPRHAALDDDDSDLVQNTPSSGSNDDFELLEQSIEMAARPRTTGAQLPAGGGKAGKRKTKPR